ncbi:TOMM precursor leader peptide-binding protein [Bdellovibrio sp. HCB-162]|uniref:TOMM precursor leader peptide-binding protein n=1 Tax=Bdellovibrio sp. HCB-162 TaxID=3394234 RepID=UPI0039BD6E30
MKYQVPRYLGIQDVQRTKKNSYVLNVGFSDHLSKKVQLDSEAMEVLKFFLQAKTANAAKKNFSWSEAKTQEVLEGLKTAKLLVEVPKRSKKFERYDRHSLFYQLGDLNGLEAQKILSQKKVALIGAGGIGNWVGLNLIGAGFKEIRIIDFDRVELTNLTRQVLFDEKDLGKLKTEVAAKALQKKNTQTKVRPVEMKVTSVKELKKVLKGMDFVILSADRPEKIHDWVDEACQALQIPYLNIGYRDGEGVVGPMTVPGRTSCYQCFKSQTSEEKTTDHSSAEIQNLFDDRYQAPSFGPLNALVSTVGSLEVIKYFTGLGELRSLDTEISVNALTLEWRHHSYHRDPHCWHCQSDSL